VTIRNIPYNTAPTFANVILLDITWDTTFKYYHNKCPAMFSGSMGCLTYLCRKLVIKGILVYL